MRVGSWAMCWAGMVWLSACEAPATSTKPRPTIQKPQLLHGEEPIAPFISGLEAAHPGQVLVYVGASWCEPCRYFHQALVDGKLDELLKGKHVVEYDLDQSKTELTSAGYSARMIPLFALPNPDGTASPRMISGSIKGAAAVSDNLVPRLRALLGGADAR